MLHQVADRHRIMSDEEWLNVLRRSVHQPVIDDVRFPAFPPDSLQTRFVGSSNEATLGEAYQFYSLFKTQSKSLARPLQITSKFLDFGCGWGRFLRFFWRDRKSETLAGVDPDADIIQTCIETGVQADLHHIKPAGRLPFADDTFTHIMAYSVFTHLPEHLHHHWLAELSRVARPGCVFICTVESRRLFEIIENMPENPTSTWLKGLKENSGDLGPLKDKFGKGEFVFIANGRGVQRNPLVYGDAAIPQTYIEKHWSDYFQIHSYIDDPTRLWQCVVVAQKLES